MRDVLLSQRFLPEFGGSIRWMYEAYRRWPRPVDVITHDYDGYPVPGVGDARLGKPFRGAVAHTSPEASGGGGTSGGASGGEEVTDPNLRMDRRDIFLRDWGLESPSRARRYLRMTRAVGERLRRGGSVRVHCTHAVPEVASLIPLKWRYGQRLQVVCYAHGEEITACLASRQLTFLMRRAHRIVDLMLANSDYTRALVSEHIDPAKVHVVHPGVDLAEFAPAPDMGARWRAQQGYQDRLVVLTVGRLDPRKNHARMIQTVARLAGRHPQLLYVIASTGREMERLKALADERGVGERVVFAGAVDAATKLAMFGGCDVFAMPAIRDGTDVEGFGMVFLEAAACGKPSIAGCEGGQAQAVRDGETGFVVDGTNLDQMAAALDRLLSDPALRQRQGEAALVHAQGFDWPEVVRRTAALVEGMASG